ncbi:Co-chaperone HscB, C-terminal oligomerization domain-containing protein [Umbelopsis sp. PMI_123]|nr:Co-chaperone HscB, C-terminal oligomerization domain-containing protein [Umbelopsis sp. PMI_123]
MFSKAVTSSVSRTTAFTLRQQPILNRFPLRPTLPQYVRTITLQRAFAAPMSNLLLIKRQLSTTPMHSHEHKVCWKCNNIVPQIDLHCSNDDCGVIQNIPHDMNFFEALEAGLGENAAEPAYDVDVKRLRMSFLRKQQQVHPDSYAQKSSHEYQLAQTQSSYLNKAYNTLKDPLARAQYMLALNGVEVAESESLEDPELLMEVMEIREQMEDAETEDDIMQLKQENNEKIEQTAEQLSKAFSSNNMEEAKELTIQLQYWDNIRRAIVDWAPGKRIEIQH